MIAYIDLLRSCGVDVSRLTPEYRFHDTRRWRVDFADIEARLAIEIEGGVYSRGRHTRASGFIKDIEKYNELACQGWRLLRFTPQDLADRPGYVRECIKVALGVINR